LLRCVSYTSACIGLKKGSLLKWGAVDTNKEVFDIVEELIIIAMFQAREAEVRPSGP
jgi:hypothetical protein